MSNTLKFLIDKHGLPLKAYKGNCEDSWILFIGSNHSWAVGFDTHGNPYSEHVSTLYSLYQPPRPKLRAWLDLIDMSIHLGGEKPGGVHWKSVKFNADDGTWEVEEV